MDVLKASLPCFLALALAVLIMQTNCQAQVSSSCSYSMLTTLTPCMNFLANSTANGTSPTSECCSALGSFMSGGTDCLCQIVTAGVPFSLPINSSTLALSLPRACNMAGVPLQCKTSSSPVAAPGPIAFSPLAAVAPVAGIPVVSSPPTASQIPASAAPSLSPISDTTPTLTPPSTAQGDSIGTSSSAATASFSLLMPCFMLLSAMVITKYS